MSKGSSQKGAALLLLVIFFLMGSLLITLGLGRTVYFDVLRARALADSKQVIYASESAVEDIIYRLRSGDTTFNTTATVQKTLSVQGVAASTTVTTVLNEKHITAASQKNNLHRTDYALLHYGGGVSFSFGLQSGDGGLIMENGSEVIGDVYANGTVLGKGTNATNGSSIRGHVVSAGGSGSVRGVVATGTIWSHSIQDASGAEAYYMTLPATTSVQINGAQCSAGNTKCHPNSPDEPFIDLPISATTTDQWKAMALAGGVISGASCPTGTLTINTSTTTGPKKIECNVVLEGNSTVLYLTGQLWITGTFEIKTGADIAIDASLPGTSLALMSDDTITLNNSGEFLGASGNSFLMLISFKGNPGSDIAIDANQGTGGEAVLYAPNGKILMSNSVEVKELTAHTVHLRNNTIVEYESGLMTLSTPDPDGGYALDEWREIE